MSGRRLRVLVLSWNYPTPAAPQRGLWVPIQALARFRQVPRYERQGNVEAYFPRVAGSVEYHTHVLDAGLAFARVLALASRLHQERPFDLIHAHFIYPDGVVASRLGRELGVPVMTTEHAFWTPWLVDQPRVGRAGTAGDPPCHRSE
jgi:hypothetical protein